MVDRGQARCELWNREVRDVRTENWRTPTGQRAIIVVQDDDTVVVSLEVLHMLVRDLEWEEIGDEDS